MSHVTAFLAFVVESLIVGDMRLPYKKLGSSIGNGLERVRDADDSRCERWASSFWAARAMR